MGKISLKRTLNPESREKVAEQKSLESREKVVEPKVTMYDLDSLLDTSKDNHHVVPDDMKAKLDEILKVFDTPDETADNSPAVVEVQNRKHENMKISEIIKCVMESEQVSQGQLKEKLEMKSQSGVSQALQRDMRVSMMLRFLKVLNCKLVVEHGDDRYEVTE